MAATTATPTITTTVASRRALAEQRERELRAAASEVPILQLVFDRLALRASLLCDTDTLPSPTATTVTTHSPLSASDRPVPAGGPTVGGGSSALSSSGPSGSLAGPTKGYFSQSLPPTSAAWQTSRLSDVLECLEELLSEAAARPGKEERLAALRAFKARLLKLPAALASDSSAVADPNNILILPPPKPSLQSKIRTTLHEISLKTSTTTTTTTTTTTSSSSSSSSSSFSSSSSSSSSSVSIECPVCFETFDEKVMKSFSTCGEHVYCEDCLRLHLMSLISEGDLQRISCPFPSCTAVPLETDIESFVPPDIFETYVRFMVVAVLREQESDNELLVWCPNPECGIPLVGWDPNMATSSTSTCPLDRAECPACFWVFCTRCYKPYHTGITCEGQDIDYLDIWRSEKGTKVKQCFQCRELVEKNAGCNHITCRCGAQWCWLCNEKFEGGHFSQGLCNGFQFAEGDSIPEARVAAQVRAIREEIAGVRSEANRVRARAESAVALLRQRLFTTEERPNTVGIETVLRQALQSLPDQSMWFETRQRIILEYMNSRPPLSEETSMADRQAEFDAERARLTAAAEQEVAAILARIPELEATQEARIAALIANSEREVAELLAARKAERERQQAEEAERRRAEEQRRLAEEQRRLAEEQSRRTAEIERLRRAAASTSSSSSRNRRNRPQRSRRSVMLFSR